MTRHPHAMLRASARGVRAAWGFLACCWGWWQCAAASGLRMQSETGTAAAGEDLLLNLICKEWPALERTRVLDLLADDEKLTEYVAEKTNHTRALSGVQLSELRLVASGISGRPDDGQLASLLERLERGADELLKGARADLLRSAREGMEKNVWWSLGIAALLGAVLGFIFRGGGRDR